MVIRPHCQFPDVKCVVYAPNVHRATKGFKYKLCRLGPQFNCMGQTECVCSNCVERWEGRAAHAPSRGHPWVLDMVSSGQLFTVRGGGVLPRGLVGLEAARLDIQYADRINLKFDRHSGSTAEVPVIKLQSNWRNLNPSLAASRPRGVLGWGVGPLLVHGGSRVGSVLTYYAEHNLVPIDR